MSTKTRKKAGKNTGKPSARKTPVGSKASAKPAASKAGPSSAKKSSKKTKTRQTKRRSKFRPGHPKQGIEGDCGKVESGYRCISALTEGAQGSLRSTCRVTAGMTVSLADFAGQKLVLFFYPRADTPGCTKEAIDFTTAQRRLRRSRHSRRRGIGRSAQGAGSISEQASARRFLSLRMRRTRCSRPTAHGAKSPCTAGHSMGILRTTVLIGANGGVIRLWRNVKVDGHADEVLAAAQAA